jgi:hypothetical protein
MAWIERFTCDVCSKLKSETEDWWMALNECASSHAGGPSQPVLKLMPWDNLLGHSSECRHLCGAGCVHTFLDRWMLEVHAGNESCAGT